MTSTSTTPESRGQIAYTTYGKKVGFTAVNGDPMPLWDDLPERIQQAWISAAAVLWDLATTGRAYLT